MVRSGIYFAVEIMHFVCCFCYCCWFTCYCQLYKNIYCCTTVLLW